MRVMLHCVIVIVISSISSSSSSITTLVVLKEKSRDYCDQVITIHLLKILGHTQLFNSCHYVNKAKKKISVCKTYTNI